MITKKKALDEFGDLSVDRLISVEDIATDNVEQIQKRALKLYEDPEARADFLTLWFIKSGYDSTVAETGNKELARVYWSSVADLSDKKISELSVIEISERGNVWRDAMSIIIAVSKRQSLIESSVALESLKLGMSLGDDLFNLVPQLKPEDLVDHKYNVADKMKIKRGATA